MIASGTFGQKLRWALIAFLGFVLGFASLFFWVSLVCALVTGSHTWLVLTITSGIVGYLGTAVFMACLWQTMTSWFD